MEEYRKELEELKAEVKNLREDLQELKTALLPFTNLLKGNGFKMALMLIIAGSVVALMGISHLFQTTIRYLVEIIKALRGV